MKNQSNTGMQTRVEGHFDLFHYSSRMLLGIVWVSSAIFGLYILANYASAYFYEDLERWNNVLPEIYKPDQPAASIGIGIHFAAGGLILLLGGLQLFEGLRLRYPQFNHWTGRLYVLISILTALGGLSFIALTGTVGGPVMDFGFGAYGLLMLASAMQTVRYAMTRNILSHQAWAWRLYALAIGSWLYRIDYGLWLILTDWLGHTDGFDGWFDYFMSFFFFIPNLIIVEFMIRARNQPKNATARALASVSMVFACGIVIVATWGFAQAAWIPAILDWSGKFV